MKTRNGIVVALAGVFALFAVVSMTQAGGGPKCGTCELAGPVQLTTGLDRPVLLRHGGAQEVVVKIDLRAVSHVKGERSPLNIAVVLDRSGSMAGKKLEQAKQAAAMLVDQLGSRDQHRQNEQCDQFLHRFKAYHFQPEKANGRPN